MGVVVAFIPRENSSASQQQVTLMGPSIRHTCLFWGKGEKWGRRSGHFSVSTAARQSHLTSCLFKSSCFPEAVLLVRTAGKWWRVAPSHCALKRGLKVCATKDYAIVLFWRGLCVFFLFFGSEITTDWKAWMIYNCCLGTMLLLCLEEYNWWNLIDWTQRH